jgi:hypothetical protein
VVSQRNIDSSASRVGLRADLAVSFALTIRAR